MQDTQHKLIQQCLERRITPEIRRLLRQRHEWNEALESGYQKYLGAINERLRGRSIYFSNSILNESMDQKTR